MSKVLCVVCLCSVISIGNSLERQPIENPFKEPSSSSPLEIANKTNASPPKLVFPNVTDESTPIIVGDDPKKSNLPPREFPLGQAKESAGPAVDSSSDKRKTEINHSNDGEKLNSEDKNISEKINTTSPGNVTKTGSPQASNDKARVEPPTAEQEDMLHSKYKGGQDVDELKPEKKASEKDEKKSVASKKDPKSEVSVSPTLDVKGPKLMNETKSGESMLESTSKMMAVSSSVLANTQPKHHGIIEPVKTVMSVLLTAVALLCFGAIGLLVWKRIAMRRHGRDVLINEDDFDEVADMHTFDRAQIQIT